MTQKNVTIEWRTDRETYEWSSIDSRFNIQRKLTYFVVTDKKYNNYRDDLYSLEECKKQAEKWLNQTDTYNVELLVKMRFTIEAISAADACVEAGNMIRNNTYHIYKDKRESIEAASAKRIRNTNDQ